MSEQVVYAKFRIRRDTAANWTSANPILEDGEPGYEKDTRLEKKGDGVTPWNSLPYQYGTNLSRFDIITATAGVQISGHVVVYIAYNGKAYPMPNDGTAWVAAGVTTGNAASGATASIQVGDEMVEAGWNWSSNSPVWLGPNGTLTQTLPTTGALVQIGVPIGPTALKIEIEFYALLS